MTYIYTMINELNFSKLHISLNGTSRVAMKKLLTASVYNRMPFLNVIHHIFVVSREIPENKPQWYFFNEKRGYKDRCKTNIRKQENIL